MKKKIKHLTLEEIFDFCKRQDCMNCPIHNEEPSKVFPGYFAVNCPLKFVFRNINKSILEEEVEIDG